MPDVSGARRIVVSSARTEAAAAAAGIQTNAATGGTVGLRPPSSSDWLARYALDSRNSTSTTYLGVDGISMPLDPADHGPVLPGMIASWNIEKYVTRLLHAVPAPGNRHARHASWPWISSCSTSSGK